MNPSPSVLRHAVATVPCLGGVGYGTGVWKVDASTRKRKQKVTPARLVGPDLLAQFKQDLTRLSPKLGAVARYCLQHHASLHLQRITHVAQHSDTQPSTVVRFAKQYGYSGFNDFKFAFLGPTPEPTQAPSPKPAVVIEPQTHPTTPTTPAAQPNDPIQRAAWTLLEEAEQTLKHWREALPHAGLEAVVNLLRQAPHIWMVGPGNSVPLASALLEGWRRQGKQVTWLVCEPQTLPPGALEGAAEADVVLWLDMDPEGGAPLKLEAQVRERVGVVSVGMRPRDGADASLILPAAGGDRRWWMTTWAQALLAGMN